jgi:protein TonB
VAGAEIVQIAGSEEAGIVMLGGGVQDQASAGDLADDGAITVTFVTVMTPERPATLQPEMIAPAAATEIVAALPADEPADAAPAETIASPAAAEELAAQEAPSLGAAGVEPSLAVASTDQQTPAAKPNVAEPVQLAPAAPASPSAGRVPARESVSIPKAAAEVLARSEPPSEAAEAAATAVVPRETSREILSAPKTDEAVIVVSRSAAAAPAPAGAATATQPPIPAAPGERYLAVTPEPLAPATEPEPLTEPANTSEARVAEALAALEDIPTPSPRPPDLTEGTQKASDPDPKREAAKGKPKRTQEAAEAKPKQLDAAKPGKAKKHAAAARETSGSRGKAESDARRGMAAGKAEGTKATAGKAGKSSSAGNAAASNYPGKVVAKLRRALRYPADARRQKLRGEAMVGFTVNADGGTRGVRLLRSSGSAVLDKAALDAVRRAAPFPSIPEAAGRSQWSFEVPLAFTR